MKWCLLGALLACSPMVLSSQMQMGGPAQTLKKNVLRHSSSGTEP